MNDKTLLNEFSNVPIATIYSDRVELSYTLDDRLGGSGFYAKVEDGYYYIVDIYDEYRIDYLGNNLVDALKCLNGYDDYFNNYPYDSNFIEGGCDDEYWMTDFEYSVRSADDFKKVISDMQKELKEGNE